MAKTRNRSRAERLRSKNLTAATAQCAKVRKRIVQARKNRDITGAEVARQMGISRPFYTQLENGTRRIDLVYFLAICGALRVDPGELLE